jgi:parallel beta-helix repeat protein
MKMMPIQFKVLSLVFFLAYLPIFPCSSCDLPNGLWKAPVLESTQNVYYVSPTGKDSNPGTLSEPWRTPEKAGSTAQAGDTVIFRGGVYDGQLAPKNSGNAVDGWITFKAFPREEPIIVHNAFWSRPINIDGVNFIEVNGLTAVAAGSNGPGIGITQAHHIRIINCIAKDSATSGIATTDGIDYIIIEGNRVYGNSNTGQYNGSGISIWNASGPIYDNKPGYHIIIRNNLIYDNRNLTNTPTDGNGIILDNNDRGGTPDLQAPNILIANNVIFDNGGRCIHVLNTSNADIVNNSCYHNDETTQIAEGCSGEINLQRTYSYSSAINIQVYNNVVYGKGGTCNSGSEEAYAFQVFCSPSGCPQFTSDYNLWYNGAVKQLGSNDIIADPIFKNPSLDPEVANFSLMPTSPAIDSGTDLFAQTVPRDYLGISRPQYEGFDRGAYEYLVFDKFLHLPLIIHSRWTALPTIPILVDLY